MPLSNDYVFFDVETTGFVKAESAPLALQPYITEICMIRTDSELNKLGTYVQMFKVPIPLEKKITEITGIKDEDLKDKNPFGMHWREIAEFVAGAKHLVAHNVTFDRDCLMYELKRSGKVLNFPWPTDHICTVEKSHHIKGHRLKLGDLYEHFFGEKFTGAHRAEADVDALIKCFGKLKEQDA
jgi:DNA polymerase III epsilon subunit-like protein